MAEIPPVVFDVSEATIARLDIQPGDRLVIQVGRSLSPAQRKELGEQIQQLFPGCRCLLLHDGLKLTAVLRESDPVACQEQEEQEEQRLEKIMLRFKAICDKIEIDAKRAAERIDTPEYQAALQKASDEALARTEPEPPRRGREFL